MSKITGGELLVQVLMEHGVRFVFSIIGGQMCTVYDSIYAHPEMRLVNLRNEAAAPVMASGYTAASGVPSVSMCTVGAGVVYEVAGLVASWLSYLPVISIAPQVQSYKMKPHQENLQACNQDEIFYPITKWNAIIYHWERIPQLVNRALREAQANVPGPVHLDIPVDVLFQYGSLSESKRDTIMPPAEKTRFQGRLPGVAEQVDIAIKKIAGAKRPVVLLGQGMGLPGRYPDLRGLLNRLGMPVILSTCSAAAMNGADEAFAGLLPLYQNSADARALLEKSDLLLIIGIDPEIMDFLKALSQKPLIVQLEVDPSAILTSVPGLRRVNADPLSFCEALAAGSGLDKKSFPEWLRQIKDTRLKIADQAKADHPVISEIFHGLDPYLSHDDVLVIDGQEPVLAAHYFLSHAGYDRLFLMSPRDMAGPGLPFAMGVKLALPEKRVTLITDQDSLFRHLQEIQTAVGLGLDLRILCVNPGEEKMFDRTAAILTALGCAVNMFSPGQSIPEKTEPRPAAFLSTAR